MSEKPTETTISEIKNESVYDKLILIKLYEDKLKQLKSEMKEAVPSDFSVTTPNGKVTKKIATRATYDGAVIYNAILLADRNPADFGQCSVKLTETQIEELVSRGIIPHTAAQSALKETTYETLRITPNKKTKQLFSELTVNGPKLLESKED